MKKFNRNNWKEEREEEVYTRKRYKQLINKGNKILKNGSIVKVTEKAERGWRDTKLGSITQVTDKAIWVKIGTRMSSYTWVDLFTRQVKFIVRKERSLNGVA